MHYFKIISIVISFVRYRKNFLRLFFGTVKALSREKQREATRFSITLLLIIWLAFSVRSPWFNIFFWNFKIIHGNYVSVQCTTLTIWEEQATQGEVEAVEPKKVVEEKEDGTKRKALTQIRKIPPTKMFYSLYYKALLMSGCLHLKPPWRRCTSNSWKILRNTQRK